MKNEPNIKHEKKIKLTEKMKEMNYKIKWI